MIRDTEFGTRQALLRMPLAELRLPKSGASYGN